MEPTEGLTEPTDRASELAVADCPACGAPGLDAPSIAIDLLGGAALRRCTHCGSRGLASRLDPAGAGDHGSAVGADELHGELPRLDGLELVEPMAEGPVGGPLPEPGLAEASEAEVCRTLASAWGFLSGVRSSEYLDRLARSTAGTMEGAPERCRVELVDEPTVRRLALPSGRLLLSVGALRAVEDEAELVFLLGHELAHVTSGDAARRLVHLGLAELSRGSGESEDAAWLRAVNDLIRLGHGPENEHRADLQGVRAVLALGYDPESVVRYLERMKAAVDRHDPRTTETALAHPLPTDRLLRVRKSWGMHLRDAGASRVNRDAFRRAVGHSALAGELEPVEPFVDEAASGPLGWPVPWRDWRLIGTCVAILLLAALFLVLGLWLAR